MEEHLRTIRVWRGEQLLLKCQSIKYFWICNGRKWRRQQSVQDEAQVHCNLKEGVDDPSFRSLSLGQGCIMKVSLCILQRKKCVAQHIHDFFLMTERNDGNITENYLSSLQTHWAIWIFLKVPGLPWWLKGLRICLQCGTPGFDPWVRKILWRRKWQLSPIFLPGKFHGPRSLVGPSPWSHKDWTRLSVWNFHFHFNTFWSDSKPSP